MLINIQNYVSSTQPGLIRCRQWIYLGDQCTANVVRDVELRANVRIQIGNGDAVKSISMVAVWIVLRICARHFVVRLWPQDYAQGLPLAVAHHHNGNRASGTCLRHLQFQLAGILNRLTVELEDDVPTLQSGSRGSTIRRYRSDQRPLPVINLVFMG